MSPADSLATVPLLDIDEATDVSLTWRIDVPRTRVWRCLTRADLLSQWLGELVSGAVGADRLPEPVGLDAWV